MAPGKVDVVKNWFEVHQVRWTKKVLSDVSDFARYASQWSEENPEWVPAFVHGSKAPQTVAAISLDGGRCTSEAVDPREDAIRRQTLGRYELKEFPKQT